MKATNEPEAAPGRSPAASGSADGQTVYVHFDGWGRMTTPDWKFGRMELAEVLQETPKRYRVRFLEEWPRGSQGDIVLIPKWAATITTKPPNTSVSEGGTEAHKSTKSDPRPSFH